MISKYKKINIKGILMGIVVIVILGAIGISINTSNIKLDKSIAKATTLQLQKPTTTSKSIVNNKSTTVSSSNIIPFSADIVIYNSHPRETYPSGMKVTDVGAALSDKLSKEGFNSQFINVDLNTDYNKSFQVTRDLVMKNVKEYSNTILLDIHIDTTKEEKSDGRKMLFVLASQNPRYEANKEFASSLLENIKNSNKVKAETYLYQFGISFYNQDLSNNSVLIDLGNNMSSDNDVEACVNELVSALTNTHK